MRLNGNTIGFAGTPVVGQPLVVQGSVRGHVIVGQGEGGNGGGPASLFRGSFGAIGEWNIAPAPGWTVVGNWVMEEGFWAQTAGSGNNPATLVSQPVDLTKAAHAAPEAIYLRYMWGYSQWQVVINGLTVGQSYATRWHFFEPTLGSGIGDLGLISAPGRVITLQQGSTSVDVDAFASVGAGAAYSVDLPFFEAAATSTTVYLNTASAPWAIYACGFELLEGP